MNDRQAIAVRACPTCYLCGTPGRELYAELTDVLFGVPGTWSMKYCPNPRCQLLWLDPMPIEADILKAYQNYYTHGDHASAGLFYQGARQIYSLLRGPIAALTGPLGVQHAKNSLSTMYLADSVNPDPVCLLEVGCGSGEFLTRMKRRGWTVQGIDIDPGATEYCQQQGLDVECGSLENIGYPPDHFDAITMNHVIEHLFDPIATLKECHRILKPGGQLVLVTPNSRSHAHEHFGPAWRGLEPPRHIHIFSPDTLRTMARTVGFKRITAFSTAANAEIIWMGSLRVHTTVGTGTTSKCKAGTCCCGCSG